MQSISHVNKARRVITPSRYATAERIKSGNIHGFDEKWKNRRNGGSVLSGTRKLKNAEVEFLTTGN